MPSKSAKDELRAGRAWRAYKFLILHEFWGFIIPGCVIVGTLWSVIVGMAYSHFTVGASESVAGDLFIIRWLIQIMGAVVLGALAVWAHKAVCRRYLFKACRGEGVDPEDLSLDYSDWPEFGTQTWRHVSYLREIQEDAEARRKQAEAVVVERSLASRKC